MRKYTRFLTAFSLVFGLPIALNAEEVTLPQGRLNLNANLELAQGKTLSDGVLLIVHGTLAHNRMEIIEGLQNLLLESELNSLAINLSLGLDDRHGMYDCATPHTHKHEDAVAEIGVWLDWLNARGAGDVVLVGHSRGGNQVARFVATQQRPQVKGVVLIAPASRESATESKAYRARFDKALEPVLDQARSRVVANQGEAMIEHVDFVYCKDTMATAASFVSYHGEDPQMNTAALMPEIRVPVLVLVGSEDKVSENLERRFAPYSGGERVTLTVIDGAGHFFRDLYAEEMVEAIVEFTDSL